MTITRQCPAPVGLLGTLLIAVTILGGCSVFGVATKGELEEAVNREAAQQRILEDRMEALAGRIAGNQAALDELDRRLAPQLAALDAEVDAVAADMDLAQQQWVSLRDAVLVDLQRLRGEFELLQADVVAVRGGMDAVSTRADRAELRSREALQVHHDQLLGERDRLRARLTELEERLQRWPADEVADAPEIAGTPPHLDVGTLSAPEGGETVETGKIEIRAVTPERSVGGSSESGGQ